MIMEHVIKIQAPEGKMPVYDETTGVVTFVDADIKSRVKSYKDALKVLNEEEPEWLKDLPWSLACMHKCKTIIRALNGDHKFNLTTGTWYYPWFRFYEPNRLPSEYDKKSLPKFRCEGKTWLLVGGDAIDGSYSGLGHFFSADGVGYSDAAVGFACKDRETAEYFSKQFGQLYFDSLYAHQLSYSWID